MSESTVKPTLSNLPPELIRMIIPRSQTLELPLNHPNLFRRPAADDPATLLALSRVSRRLREIILPELWKDVLVRTIKELGKLGNLLESSPGLARHIRGFTLIWDMGGDCSVYWRFPEEEGKTLDLAFTNRLELWERRRDEYGCEVTHQENVFSSDRISYFHYRGKVYEAPGRRRVIDGKYDPSDAREGGNGPDGEGEDKRIKNPQQFTSSLVNLIRHLPSIVDFHWVTAVAPMPRPVLDALIERGTIASLGMDLSEHRDNVHDLPFWELSKGLSSLVISFGIDPSFVDDDVYKNCMEQSEETFEAMEVPLASPPRTVRAKNKFHLNIASRTIIAAARSGRLRKLNPSVYVQHPFAIRSLVPFWVLIEYWEDSEELSTGWARAAMTIRPLLSHASLWLGTSASVEPREDRHLTPQEIQSLQSHFEEEGPPEPFHERFGQRNFAVGRYLPWLAEGEDLATMVSRVWNIVVKRGGADRFRCDCERCEAIA